MSEQRKALEASIAHWEDVVEKGLGAATGPKECALCRAYNNDEQRQNMTSCLGCPIVTTGLGEIYCDETPYNEVWKSQTRLDHINFDVHARRELAFLQKVLAALPYEGDAIQDSDEVPSL